MTESNQLGTEKIIAKLENRIAELENERNRKRPRHRRATGAVAALFAAGLLLVGMEAVTAPSEILECENSDLFCFTSNTPAKSTEINHNFQQLSLGIADRSAEIEETLNLVETKIGPLEDPDVDITGSLYLDGSIGEASETISIPGNLSVGGDITLGGAMNNLSFRKCDGGDYNCSPAECLALCIENGERMALIDEVFAWASAGNDSCAYMWMLDRNNIGGAVFGYPMYTNQTASNCGSLNTGNVPRIEGFGTAAWTSTEYQWNCACAKIK